jgi:hypothetical protein
VLQRAETAHVLGPLLRAAPPRRTAVRLLIPAPGRDAAAAAAALRDLADYLQQRSRCGVVRLPACDEREGGGAAPARTLYLIPPAAGVAAALGAPEPAGESGAMLWALVLPGDAK